MKIGELAQATGTDIQTIRFYEREQLLDEPSRTAGNYRIYAQPDVGRLLFIRHCRSLNMSLDEIRVLLRFADGPAKGCAPVTQLLDEHLQMIDGRIRELKQLRSQLQALRGCCEGKRSASDCGILKGLAAPGAAAVKSRSH